MNRVSKYFRLKDIVESNSLIIEALYSTFRMRIPLLQEKLDELMEFLPNIDIDLYDKISKDQREKIVQMMDQYYTEQEDISHHLNELMSQVKDEGMVQKTKGTDFSARVQVCG